MSELNFSFPIVRNIEDTRARHQNRIDKLVKGIPLKSKVLFLNKVSNDDLFESIMYDNRRLFSYYPADYWKGQKGVKLVKAIVNSYVRDMICGHLHMSTLPRSWDTAYYLLHQSQIDARMEAVSKLLYAELS